MLKLTVETALNKELDEHLGYEKHAVEGHNSGNSPCAKTLKGDHGEVVINTPHDRTGSFEPQMNKKNQTCLTQFAEQILCLCAKGMTTREIVHVFEEMFGADVDFKSHRCSTG